MQVALQIPPNEPDAINEPLVDVVGDRRFIGRENRHRRRRGRGRIKNGNFIKFKINQRHK